MKRREYSTIWESQNNTCYEYQCREDIGAVFLKRENASEWENQTDECVEFICDSANGTSARSLCNESTGTMCFNNKCVSEDAINGRYIIIVKFDDSVYMNYEMVINTIQTVTEVEMEQVEIGVKYNDDGSVFEVHIVTEIETIMRTIITKIDEESSIHIQSVEENNLCYEIVHIDNEWIEQKKEEAKEWENQTNGCVTYLCDNEAGNVMRSKCNDNPGSVCFDNNCVNENDIKGNYIVIIEFNDVVFLDPEKVIRIIVTSTDVDIDKMNIAIEYNDDGSVSEVHVVVEDEATSKVIVEMINLSPSMRADSIKERPKVSELVLSEGNKLSLSVVVSMLMMLARLYW